MSDQLIVEPLDNDEASTGLETNISVEALTAAGDVLSQSLLFSVGRNYLDGPIFAANYVRLVDKDIPQAPDIAFIELEQVGQPVDADPGRHLAAIQTTLAAAHDPRYALLFLVSSDGLRNNIYIGIDGRAPGTQPRLFAEQLGQFLCSNWPGTRVKSVSDYNQIVQKVHVPLSRYRHAQAFTGIPSARSDQGHDYPQSLDQLMRGLRGKPYLYMVIAEPMSETAVGEIINACRTLSGQVHAFAKTTIQRSISEGLSTSTARGESDSTSTSTTRGRPSGRTTPRCSSRARR